MDEHKPHTLESFPIYVPSLDSFIHYTCNSPSIEVLNKNSILLRGNYFGCKDPREVLQIPFRIYKKHGFVKFGDKDVLNINLEKIMRDLK